MALHYTRAPFAMLCASGTVGIHLVYLISVLVAKFSVEHALSCSHGGFPLICHNELRDITTKLMSKVYHIVGTEPSLQPIIGASRVDGSQLDADSFWDNDGQRAFFDIRVSTLLLLAVRTPLWPNATDRTSWRRNEPTTE